MGARMIPYASIFAKRTGRYVFCRYCALPCTRAMAVACVVMRKSRAKHWRRDFVTYVSQHIIHFCTVIYVFIKEICFAEWGLQLYLSYNIFDA